MTLMRSACWAANILPLLDNTAVQSQLGELVEAYSQFSNEDWHGTCLHDKLSLKPAEQEKGKATSTSKEVKLDQFIFQALLGQVNNEDGQRTNDSGVLYIQHPETKLQGQRYLSDMSVSCTEVQIKGIKYQPFLSFPGNSNVMFQMPGSHHVSAGQISQIFLHKRLHSDGMEVEETFLVILPLAPLTPQDVKCDNYCHYEITGGALYYDRYKPIVHVLWPADIVSHFAKSKVRLLGMKKKELWIHVLALDHFCIPIIDLLASDWYFMQLQQFKSIDNLDYEQWIFNME